MVHGGNDPVQHMVQAVVLPAALQRGHVLGVGHHADKGGIPAAAGTDRAGAVALGEVLAEGTAVDGALCG